MLRLISSFYCCVRNFYRHSGFKQRIFIISQFLRVRGPGWSSVQALTRLPSRCWLMAFSSGGSTEENPLPSALRLLKAFPCCYVTDDPEFLLAINWRAPSDSRGVHVPKWVRSATWVFSESIWTAITRYYRVGGWAVQFSSVAQMCPTLCELMDLSMPGFSVHHQLPEFTQTHVHWVGDVIQPSHPLSPPSPPAFNLSQHQGLFQWVCSSHQGAKVLEFQLQHQSFQWTPRTDLL